MTGSVFTWCLLRLIYDMFCLKVVTILDFWNILKSRVPLKRPLEFIG